MKTRAYWAGIAVLCLCVTMLAGCDLWDAITGVGGVGGDGGDRPCTAALDRETGWFDVRCAVEIPFLGGGGGDG